MNILVVGYTYISNSQRETFKFYPNPDNLFFLLPDLWKARYGKVVLHGPREKNIFLIKTFFSHSNYPFIGGTLKGWMPALPLALLRLKWKKKIKLVYSCSEPALLTTLYNGFWAKFFGLKYVAYSWENIPYEKKYSGKGGYLRKLILRLSLSFCDGLICGNRKSVEIHRGYMGHKPMAFFPMNGLDPEFFKPQGGPKTFNGTDLRDKIVFSFVGAIDKRKGVHHIVGAFPEVLKELPAAHLIIAGSGDNDMAIRDQIEKLHISEHVTRVPWIDRGEVVKLHSVSDVFVYPSLPHRGWEEQFGYAIAEASLMGLPVLSTDSGSIEDVVLSGKTGVLVPPDNMEALCDAMVRLGKDMQLREQFGKAGREYAAANFLHEVIAKKFHVFFNSLT